MSRAKHNLLNLGHLSHETRFCSNCCMDLSHNIIWLVSGTLFATRIHLFAPFLLAEINPLAKTRVFYPESTRLGRPRGLDWAVALGRAGGGQAGLSWLGLADSIRNTAQYCSLLLSVPPHNTIRYWAILFNTTQHYSILVTLFNTGQYLAILFNTTQHSWALLYTIQ